MNAQDKKNIAYVVKSLRENVAEMNEIMDGCEASSPKYTTAHSAANAMKVAYMMLLSAMQFGDLEWQQHQDEIVIPSDARYIKNGKLV